MGPETYKGWVKEWKTSLWNIWQVHIGMPEITPSTIFISRCSKTKTGKDKALPKEFYVSALNNKFYAWAEKHKLYYGILSDLYGIHFCDEYKDFYDIHPSSLSMERKKELGEIIGTKCKEKGYSTAAFYNSAPAMSKPYFDMLWFSGLKIHFITQLPDISKLLPSTQEVGV